jgi:hypothetical protein
MRKVFLCILVLAVAVPVLAQADARPHPPEPKRAVARFLQLSVDQVMQWDVLLEQRKATVEPLRQTLADVETQLEQLLAEEAPDPATVGSLVIQAKDLKGQIADANHAYVEGFEAMLTVEQAGRLAFIRRAEAAQPLFPAFRLFGLLPPEG